LVLIRKLLLQSILNAIKKRETNQSSKQNDPKISDKIPIGYGQSLNKIIYMVYEAKFTAFPTMLNMQRMFCKNLAPAIYSCLSRIRSIPPV